MQKNPFFYLVLSVVLLGMGPTYLHASASVPTTVSTSSTFIIVGAGQSNMLGYFSSGSSVTLTNLLQKSGFKKVLWQNAAIGSSALDKTVAGSTNYYVQQMPDGSFVPGPRLKAALATVKKNKEGLGLFLWQQGEVDGARFAKTNRSKYVAELEYVINSVRTEAGNPLLPVGIIETGKIVRNLNDAGYQEIREAQREVAARMPQVELLASTYDLPQSDGLHFTVPAQKKILSERVGPNILRWFGVLPGSIQIGPSLISAQQLSTSTIQFVIGPTTENVSVGKNFFKAVSVVDTSTGKIVQSGTGGKAVNTTTYTVNFLKTIEKNPAYKIYFAYSEARTFKPDQAIMYGMLPLRSTGVFLEQN